SGRSGAADRSQQEVRYMVAHPDDGGLAVLAAVAVAAAVPLPAGPFGPLALGSFGVQHGRCFLAACRFGRLRLGGGPFRALAATAAAFRPATIASAPTSAARSALGLGFGGLRRFDLVGMEAGQFHDGDVAGDQAGDRRDVFTVLARDQREGAALHAGSAGAADAVDVILRMGRHVEIEYM